MLGNQSEQSGFQLFNRKTTVAAHVTSRGLGDHDSCERRLKGLEDRRNSRQLILQPGEGFQDILKTGGFRQGLNDGGRIGCVRRFASQIAILRYRGVVARTGFRDAIDPFRGMGFVAPGEQCAGSRQFADTRVQSCIVSRTPRNLPSASRTATYRM